MTRFDSGDTVTKDKLKQVYLDCLRFMSDGKPCERVSEKEEGLDGCKHFGTPPWNTYLWTDKEKKIVEKKLGPQEYTKTLACLKKKAASIVKKSDAKRTRMKKTDDIGTFSKPGSSRLQAGKAPKKISTFF